MPTQFVSFILLFVQNKFLFAGFFLLPVYLLYNTCIFSFGQFLLESHVHIFLLQDSFRTASVLCNAS